MTGTGCRPDGSEGFWNRLLESADEQGDAFGGFFHVGHGATIAGADVAFAAGAEGIAGHDRDTLLFEQLHGELARGQAGSRIDGKA